VPDYADEIIYLGDSNDKETNVQPTEYYAKEMASIEAEMTENHNPSQSDVVVEMNKVSIRYGERTILRGLDWVIRKGERWALCGQNGSGKSTLLSLICADNPQSYACDIKLFGNQRGHGESIWEIKRRIGYVSPEMHRSYMRNIPTINVVASGLKDTVGLYIRANESEKNQCLKWMRLFGIEHLAQRSFLTLSSGEQRLALVARAFVKCPELLILDEPLHGLDNNNRQLVKNIIEAYCQDKSKTLIMVTHYEEELPECITKRKTLEKIKEPTV
jgi:molybdate transport system ATP-binding protein